MVCMGDAFSVPFILSCSQPIRARGIIIKYVEFAMTDKKALKTHFNPHLSMYILIYIVSSEDLTRLQISVF